MVSEDSWNGKDVAHMAPFGHPPQLVDYQVGPFSFGFLWWPFLKRASCSAVVVVRRTTVQSEVMLMPSCDTAFSALMSSGEGNERNQVSVYLRDIYIYILEGRRGSDEEMYVTRRTV